MASKPVTVEPIPFRGLSLSKVTEVDIELIADGRTVMVFMRRASQDAADPDQIVRMWISQPDPRDYPAGTVPPLRVTVEGE